MSQTTITQGNQSGYDYVQSMNAVAAALATDFSGNTEPVETFAYMLWRDTSTSPSTLRIRNSTNTAWAQESSALYTLLEGFSVSSGGVVTAADSVLSALGKLQGQASSALQKPLFRAYATSGTSVAQGTSTKVFFQQESFDPNYCYDPTTSRFTPNVAGFYSVTVSIRLDVPSGNQLLSAGISKNGTILSQGSFTNISTTQSLSQCTDIVYCNGTTDYIEGVVAYSAATGTTSTGSPVTYFCANFVRAA